MTTKRLTDEALTQMQKRCEALRARDRTSETLLLSELEALIAEIIGMRAKRKRARAHRSRSAAAAVARIVRGRAL
jgi:hypothetical protein